MPARWLTQAFEECFLDLGDDSKQLRQLAERFKVSIQALTIRLANLSLLEL
jgi:Zn-dependent peptidase ImmA (M78 family)